MVARGDGRGALIAYVDNKGKIRVLSHDKYTERTLKDSPSFVNVRCNGGIANDVAP